MNSENGRQEGRRPAGCQRGAETTHLGDGERRSCPHASSQSGLEGRDLGGEGGGRASRGEGLPIKDA